MRCSICETDVSERALFCEVCGNRVRRPAVAQGPLATRTRATAATATAPPPAPPLVARDDLAAAVETRAELGERMEPEVLDAFLARIEQAVVTRVDQQMDLRMRGPARVRSKNSHGPSAAVPVAICSLIFGIPLSAVAADGGGLPGLIVAWAGIAVVNIAVNAGRRE